MSINNERRSVTLWHLNGCLATFYEIDDTTHKKVPTETVCFINKVYLGFKRVDTFTISPPAIPYLRHLSSLQLQNNNLTTIPEEIWRLTSLEQLDLGSNQLRQLSPSVGCLINLRTLLIHNNNITTLPSQLGRLKKLELLDVTNNQLSCLPCEILGMKLKNLWLDNNQFIPYETGVIKTPTIPSLRSLCMQMVGLLCAEDEEVRCMIEDMPSVIKEEILVNEELIPKCHICESSVFHDGLLYIKSDQQRNIPYEYRACKHTCLINIIKSA
ncbi:hypothetical protein BDB01DRAFT_832159 [Pilobolus umbonatus]|nr:hypothetical protein BDB01DRAFT_832159 [Pilobolus umbonatus]